MKVVWLLTRMALRRRMNRMEMWRRRKETTGAGAAPPKRRATPKKSHGGKWLLWIVGPLFVIQICLFTAIFLKRLTAELERPGEKVTVEAPEETIEIPGGPEAGLQAFNPGEEEPAPGAERAAERRYSLDGPSWPRPENESRMISALGVLLLLLFLSYLLSTMGMGNQELGQVEWGMEWLITFPVSGRALFFSKMIEYGFGSPTHWIVFLPLLFVVYFCAGPGLVLSLALAAVSAFFLMFTLGAVQLVIMTWARKRLGRGQRKNTQALFTAVGLLGIMGTLGLVISEGGSAYLVPLGDSLGGVVSKLPLTLPLHVCRGGMVAAFAVAGIAGCTVVFGFAAVLLAQRLVRDGLVSETGPFQGKRTPGASRGVCRSRWFKGVVGKDFRLLLRDRNLLVQTLVLPVIILGFQVVCNPHIGTKIVEKSNHASMAAFIVGAYVLMFSAFYVLSVEGKALWILYTFPHSLDRIIFRKAAFWALFASVFPVAILTYCFSQLPAIGPLDLVNGFIALSGVVVYSFIAAGIGALGTDCLGEEFRRKARPAAAWSSMLLMGLYAHAVYSEAIWQKLAMLVLFALLAFALRQKVRDRTPFLLDPTQTPPPSLSLSDGLVALLGFFVFQGVFLAFLVGLLDLPPGPSLALSFFSAGGLAFACSLAVFSLRKIPNLSEEIGFTRNLQDPVSGARNPVVEGVVWGAAAVAVGLGFIRCLEVIAPMQLQNTGIFDLQEGGGDTLFWIAMLCLLGAPIFEEYLFRGLIYRGLRRTWRPAAAVVASAALFAVVHPPISMVPVFCLGILTAVAFERTRSILTPMIIHALYNAGILLAHLV